MRNNCVWQPFLSLSFQLLPSLTGNLLVSETGLLLKILAAEKSMAVVVGAQLALESQVAMFLNIANHPRFRTVSVVPRLSITPLATGLSKAKAAK